MGWDDYLARYLFGQAHKDDVIGWEKGDGEKFATGNKTNRSWEWEDYSLTESSRDRFRELAKKTEKEAKQILKELKLDGLEGGIEQSRYEVTGLGGKSTNKNLGNSGFSGGCMARLVAA